MCQVGLRQLRVFEAGRQRREAKGEKSGVDGERESGWRTSNEAKGSKSLPKTRGIDVAAGGNAAAEAREARKLRVRQAKAGHARKHSRDQAGVMRRLESEAAGGGGGFAH
jgi:hypothetical protein